MDYLTAPMTKPAAISNMRKDCDSSLPAYTGAPRAAIKVGLTAYWTEKPALLDP